MKRIIFILIATFFYSCGIDKNQHLDVVEKNQLLEKELQVSKDSVLFLKEKIDSLEQQVFTLSYPADQRLNHITKLIDENLLDSATIEISNLKRIFPYSKESIKADEKQENINKKKLAVTKEEERRKALGFKIFKDQSKITITENDGDILKCTFSGFYFGKTFSFDYIYDVSESYCRTADKDNTYILADLSLSTKAKYAYPPSVYAYSIVDGKLNKIGYFTHEYATWETYGAFIGNYSETSHDFSKVNTVNYKLAAEITIEESKKPIIILMFKNNNSKNITIDELDVESVNKYCDVIRIINRNKI